jgi:hypothetical protein
MAHSILERAVARPEGSIVLSLDGIAISAAIGLNIDGDVPVLPVEAACHAVTDTCPALAGGNYAFTMLLHASAVGVGEAAYFAENILGDIDFFPGRRPQPKFVLLGHSLSSFAERKTRNADAIGHDGTAADRLEPFSFRPASQWRGFIWVGAIKALGMNADQALGN